MAAHTETAGVKSSTRPSSEISSTRGNVPGKVLPIALTGAQQSKCSRHGREQNALGNQLAKNSRCAGAHSRANRKLTPAGGRASQKKIRGIGTRNQQQETDGGEKHQEKRLDIANHIVLHRDEANAGLFVGHRKGSRQVTRHHVHIGLNLRERNARPNPAYRVRVTEMRRSRNDGSFHWPIGT
jgi:hypothetical protein